MRKTFVTDMKGGGVGPFLRPLFLLCLYSRPERRLSRSIEIGLVRDFYRYKVFYQEVSVGGLFVFALFVHEPDDVQPVLSAVITDAEGATDVCIPNRCLGIASYETKYRTGRNDFWQHRLLKCGAPWCLGWFHLRPP
jgi:hypothetical protein